MTDEELDYVESRLYRGFGVEVRPDLQIRAEIILQRKTVGGCSPPTQRSGGGHQLDTTKLEPRCRVAFPPRSSNTSGCSVHRVGSVSAGAYS